METMEWKYVDKSGWERGEWDNEPDKIQWQDAETGMPCLIVRNHSGALCGYVGITKEDARYGVDCSDDTFCYIGIHGGLTFSGGCSGDEHGICHVVPDDEDDDVWWLGFDCAHSGDEVPGLGYELRHWLGGQPTYKNVDYVKREVALLALQLKRDKWKQN